MVAAPGRNWSSLGKEERKKAVLKEVAHYFGEEAQDCTGYFEKNWVEEEWNRGCPAGIIPTGSFAQLGRVSRTTEWGGKIHFAGTENALKFAGYMDGAVESGERAAREVIDAVSGKVVDEESFTILDNEHHEGSFFSIKWLFYLIVFFLAFFYMIPFVS